MRMGLVVFDVGDEGLSLQMLLRAILQKTAVIKQVVDEGDENLGGDYHGLSHVDAN